MKTCIKTLEKIEILLLKILFENNQEMGYLYPHFKSACWQLKRARLPFRSTGQRSHFLPLSPAVDRPVDRPQIQRATALWPVDHPVDWSWIQRADCLSGRPTRSTRDISREQSSLGDRPSRSTAAVVGRPVRSTLVHASFGLVAGRPGRSTGSKPVSKFWDLKT